VLIWSPAPERFGGQKSRYWVKRFGKVTAQSVAACLCGQMAILFSFFLRRLQAPHS
jgi:hypothetical protein